MAAKRQRRAQPVRFLGVSPSSSNGERGAQAHTPWGNNDIYFDTAGCCDTATQRLNGPWDGDWDEWNHFAFVKDGEAKRIYVNGTEDAGGPFLEGTNTSPLPDDFTELWIGSAAGGANSVPGILDEFGVFAGILSDEEIDRLSDEEGTLVTDLVKFIDEDGDGMHDKWEERNGLDPTVDDGALDPDGDTLTNKQEYDARPRTNPNSADTDEDGIDDQFETNTGTWVSTEDTGTNPAVADTDRDKLLDGVENPDLPFVDENQPGTDPNNRDTDGDGALDGLEVIGGITNPLDKLDVASNQFIGGQWTVQHAWTDGGTVSDLDTALAALNGDVALSGNITVEHPFLHFHDDAGPPWFGEDSVPYPLWNNEDDGFGDRNGFAIRATGRIFIKNTGLVSFVCNSDDGFSLRIDGNEIGSAGDRGRGNTVMEVELDRGVHDVEFIHWENGGRAGVTVAIHRGTGTAPAPDGENWELLRAFNPHEVVTEDTDGDGIDDFKETFFFGDLSRDGSGDFDGDGLSDNDEFDRAVDPDNTDHDGDGLEDGPEVATHNTDPGNADSDGDSLADGAEVNEHQTDPTIADSDDDSFDDNIELALDNDPNDANNKPNAIIAVRKGSWDNSIVWSNGETPSAGNNYVVVNTVIPSLESSTAFGGDKLTIIGPDATLVVGHRGIVTIPELVSRQAMINIDRGTTGLGGALVFEGANTINTAGGVLDLRSQLSGAGPVTVTSGGPGENIGGVILGGIGNDYHGGWSIIGTTVTVNTPHAAGTGGIFLAGGRLIANAEVYAPENTLDIAGDDFGLELNAMVTVNDLRGVDPETGAEVFQLSQLEMAVGVSEFTADDLRNLFGVDDSVISGDSLLHLAVAADPDADGDGIRDGYETADLDPNSDDDGDGLSALWEFRTGADVANADTDGDGLNDGDEVAVNANPLVADTDGDGTSDSDEAACGSDPNNDRDLCGAAPLPAFTLLGYWNFNDPSNPEAAVSSVGGVTADFVDGAAYTADAGGFSGAAGDYGFDLGTDQANQHAVVDAAFMNPAGDEDAITIAFFQKLSAVVNSSSFWLIGEGEGGSRAIQAHVPWGDNHIYLDSAGCCDTATQRLSAPATIDFTEWHHFAFVKDGPDKTIYIDGQVFLEGENTGILPSPFTEFYIGSESEKAGVNSIQGVLDEFAVFQGGLDQSLIAQLAAGTPADQVGQDGGGGDGAGSIGAVTTTPDGISLSFPAGSTYDVEHSTDLQSWSVIASDITGPFEDTDAARAQGGGGYYRGVLK